MAASFVHVHLVALRYFSETVRSGSMRQAAEHLSVAASAINRQIMKLEDQLQCRLFERRAEGVRLTAAGEVLYHYVRRLDQDLERAIAQIDDLRGLRRGHVRIACEEGIGRDFLPQVLAGYHAAHPGVTFTVEIAAALDVLAQVAADEIEIGLTLTPPIRADVAIAARAEMPLGVIAPPGSPILAKASLRLSDVAGEPLIRGKAGTGGVTAWEGHVERDVTRRSLIETNALDFATNLVKAGLGIGMRTPVGIIADLEHGALAFVPVRDPLAPNPSLTVFVRSQRLLSGAGAVMLEELKAALPVFGRRVWDLTGQAGPSDGATGVT